VIPRAALAGYSISRIIKGGWHLAGDHGGIDPRQAQIDMATFVDAGITTFDCADIYTGVEALIGEFRHRFPTHARRVQVHTKFVPDLSDLVSLSRVQVEASIDRSLKRLKTQCLDLVQFHWWDYSVPRYVEVAFELQRLCQAGKIARIGITNFGTPQLRELIAAGIPIFSHQVQYSLIDDRPIRSMTALCQSHGIALLCYGTVCGGFLSERWLGRGRPGSELTNRSLIKYRLMIDEFGGWDLFQDLLLSLRRIAERHGVDIATVASRMILDRAQVAAVIVGAVNTSHLAAHQRIGDLQLDRDDDRSLQSVEAQRRSPAGDVYQLERDREGIHGRIMKYGLNAAPFPQLASDP
jgi:aryl-alcohol dehydrogenase-like predicted oxidoreductase